MKIIDTEIRSNIAERALAEFFRITKQWELSREYSMVLLGVGATSTYANWKRGNGRNIPRDTLERIAYIVAIHNAIADDTGMSQRGWLEGTVISKRFKLSLFELMLTGNVTDLYLTRQIIEKAAVATQEVTRVAYAVGVSSRY